MEVSKKKFSPRVNLFLSYLAFTMRKQKVYTLLRKINFLLSLLHFPRLLNEHLREEKPKENFCATEAKCDFIFLVGEGLKLFH